MLIQHGFRVRVLVGFVLVNSRFGKLLLSLQLRRPERAAAQRPLHRRDQIAVGESPPEARLVQPTPQQLLTGVFAMIELSAQQSIERNR